MGFNHGILVARNPRSHLPSFLGERDIIERDKFGWTRIKVTIVKYLGVLKGAARQYLLAVNSPSERYHWHILISRVEKGPNYRRNLLKERRDVGSVDCSSNRCDWVLNVDLIADESTSKLSAKSGARTPSSTLGVCLKMRYKCMRKYKDSLFLLWTGILNEEQGILLQWLLCGGRDDTDWRMAYGGYDARRYPMTISNRMDWWEQIDDIRRFYPSI